MFRYIVKINLKHLIFFARYTLNDICKIVFFFEFSLLKYVYVFQFLHIYIVN